MTGILTTTVTHLRPAGRGPRQAQGGHYAADEQSHVGGYACAGNRSPRLATDPGSASAHAAPGAYPAAAGVGQTGGLRPAPGDRAARAVPAAFGDGRPGDLRAAAGHPAARGLRAPAAHAAALASLSAR